MSSARKNTAIASRVSIANSAKSAICHALAIALVSMLFFFATQSARAQTESVLYTFTSIKTGVNPVSGLVRDKQGNLFGTTYQGGSTNCRLGCGTVFELTSSGTLKVLYTFGGKPDGATPVAGLILDKDGNLYGTTEDGGASGDGTVFEITAAGKYKVIHSFMGTDGGVPYGGLFRDSQGNLYGTTEYGGANYGTVFKITPDGMETVLYTFTNGADGGAPLGSLVFGRTIFMAQPRKEGPSETARYLR